MIYLDPQILQSQVFYAGVTSTALEIIKKSKFMPQINMNSDTLNRYIGIGMAILTAAGISIKYSYSPEGLFTLQIANLTFWGIYDSIKTSAFQYMIQQWAYKNVIKKTSNSLTTVTTSN